MQTLFKTTFRRLYLCHAFRKICGPRLLMLAFLTTGSLPHVSPLETYIVRSWDLDLTRVGTNKIHSLFQLFYPSIFHPSDLYLWDTTAQHKVETFKMEMMCHPSKQRPPAKFFSASAYHFHRASNAGIYHRCDGAGRRHAPPPS